MWLTTRLAGLLALASLFSSASQFTSSRLTQFSIQCVSAQAGAMALPSGSPYTWFALGATAAAPLAQTSNFRITGQISNTAYAQVRFANTVIPCQQPFSGGAGVIQDNARLEVTFGAPPFGYTVTGASVAFWIFLSDYEMPLQPQEFFDRDILMSAVSSLDFRVGLLNGTASGNGFDQLCIGQGISPAANTANAPITACVAPGLVPVQTWVHIGVKLSRDATLVAPRIYVNGINRPLTFLNPTFVQGPSFTNAANGYFIGRSASNTALTNGLMRNLVTSTGILTDADFNYLATSVAVSATACDPNTFCPAKGNTEARCYALRSQCKWTGTACAGGPPVECTDFRNDATGCNTRSDCNIKTDGMCDINCSLLSLQVCKGTTPPRDDCRLNYATLNSTSRCIVSQFNGFDNCQNKVTATSCGAAGCFWDPYELNCFQNLTQSNQVFPCSWWPQNFGVSTPACADHGCVLSGTTSCINVVSTANTADNSTTINYARRILFLNATVVPNTQIFRVSVGVPFTTSARPDVQWPLSPSWPVIQLLFPVVNVGQFANTNITYCSSQRSVTGFDQPVDLVQSPFSQSVLQNYILDWIRRFNNLSFNLTDPVGRAANAIYNNPVIGPGQLITGLAVNTGTYLWFLVEVDLVKAAQLCSIYGVTTVTQNNNKITKVPLSYEEENSRGGWNQFTILYTITQPLNGTALISTTTNYHQAAFALETVFPTSECPTGQAKMQIKWQIELRDVFDATRRIGPRYFTDFAARSPVSALGPNNCYGDTLSNFQDLGCNYQTYTCTYQITTKSRCRALTLDGEAFNLCSNSLAADRIADNAGDLAYPGRLDAYHEFFVNSYSCPVNRVNDLQCTLVTNSVFGLPDQVAGYIRTSQYLQLGVNGNPFEVQSGLLPFATAPLSAANILSNTFGVTNGLQRFDGNIFSRQPVSVIFLLPLSIRFTYDLRINNVLNDTVIVPLDPQGNALSTGPFIRLGQFAPAFLFSPKNVFDSRCNNGALCQKLPACNGVLGCDGFSVPVSVLLALQRGNGFRFQFNYRVGVPNVNGTTPNAASSIATGLPLPSSTSRRLLQTVGEDENSHFSSVQRRLLQTTVETDAQSPMLSGDNNQAPPPGGDVAFAFALGEEPQDESLDTPELRAQCSALFGDKQKDSVREAALHYVLPYLLLNVGLYALLHTGFRRCMLQKRV